MRWYSINFLFKLTIILVITACGHNGNENGSISENNLTEINRTMDGNRTIDGNITVDGNRTIDGNITLDGNSTITQSNIQGVVQKGLFFDGVVTIHYLDNHGKFSKEEQRVKINKKGEYRLYLKETGLVVFNAKGHFFNEYKEQNSTEEAELFALVDYKRSDDIQEINLNLFTSFEYVRLLKLIENGKTYKEALKITRKDMKREFGLDENIEITKLNIYDINGKLKNENKNLLLLSGAFLKSIDDNLSKSKRDNSFYAKFRKKDLETFLLNFKDSGKMDGKSWTLMKKYNMNELLNRLSSNLGIEEGIDSNDLQSFSWTVNSAQTLTPPRRDTTSFITTWKTNNRGLSGDNEIIVPLKLNTLSCDIDWTGDGTWERIFGGEINKLRHTYPNAGTYTVKIRGDFSIYFNNSKDKDKILSVEQWGNIKWKTMEKAFMGCSNLRINATDKPDLSNVTNMEFMFSFAESLNQSLNHWDVSNIINMKGLFSNAKSFNQPLDNWDVSNVRDMSILFSSTKNFNQPLNNWDVSNIINMKGLFSNAKSFNQPLDNWDVSKVTNMSYMFAWADLFNQPLNNWNIANVENIKGMFDHAVSFNQPLNKWNTSKVINMERTFFDARLFNNSINDWNVSNITNMQNMFSGALRFNKPLNNWDVHNLINMSKMFRMAESFNQPLNDWNVTNVKYMYRLFGGAQSFNQKLDHWAVDNVEDMSFMFSGAYSFNQPLNSWNVKNVINMEYMFYRAATFNQPLNSWNVKNVTNMEHMFSLAGIFNQPLSNWNVENVIHMEHMFFKAKSFNQSLSSWNIRSVVNMDYMFSQATSFNHSLGDWNISSVKSMNSLLYNVKLSSENYDKTLKAWSAQSLYHPIVFDGGKSQYCFAKDERDYLTSYYHWTISDGGEALCIEYRPIITSPNFMRVNENKNNISLRIEATAQNSLHPITYTIVGGDDMGIFDLNKTTGILKFREIPNFEYPKDNNKDNNYTIDIEVDNGYFTEKEIFTIEVLDIYENISTLAVAQKGPFLKNMAKVTAYPLINGVRDSSIKVEADIVNQEGGYHFKLPLEWNQEPQLWNSDVELVASGKYYNELTGEEDEIELSVVVKDTDINSTYPNINLLTDMEARMVKQYLKKLPFDNTYLSFYRFLAQETISDFFDLGKNIDFAKLNLLNGNGVYKEQNAELLRLSKSILQQSINANKEPKDILNALSDELFIWGGVEQDSLMVDIDKIKEYANDKNGFNNASNNLRKYSDIDFVPTFRTLGESINDSWLNHNSQPTIQNFSGDIEGDMVTVFDNDTNMVHYEVFDEESNPDNLWLSFSIFRYSNVSRPMVIDADYRTGFNDYINNLGLAFVCDSSSTINYLLEQQKPYDEMVLYLKDLSHSNCLLVEKDGDKANVTLPISYYNFVQGNVDTPYKKDSPFLFPISANDGQYIKKREIIILFRDKNRANPLNNSTEILFDNDTNNYVVKGIVPTHISWATRWSITGKPDWAIFDTTTGELSGVASENEVGSYDINITGYKTFPNGMVAKDTESFTLKLLPTDRIPNSFEFTPQWDVAPNASVETSITLSGLSNSAVASLSGDGLFEILREGIKANTNRIVRDGDTIKLFMNASSSYSSSKYLTLTIGGISATWRVTTRPAPTTNDSRPNGFSFAQKDDVEFLTIQEESVTISGINTTTSIQVTNGEYSLDRGASWRTVNGSISNGQIVYVRHVSGDSYGARTETTLTVGGVRASFVSVVKESGDKATPPTLQPFVSSFYMDNDFRLDFIDNTLWRSRISKVKLVGSLSIITDINGIELNEGTDYTLSNGQLLIHSQVLHNRLGGDLMDYMGSWNIIVEATSYEPTFCMFEVTDGVPIITTPLQVTIPENQQEVQQVNAIGKGNLTFAVNVAFDGAKFSIDIITGVLRFKVAPDFETPESLENSNRYKVQVSVIGIAGTTVETIVVDVTDVLNETSNNSCDCPDFIDCMAN